MTRNFTFYLNSFFGPLWFNYKFIIVDREPKVPG